MDKALVLIISLLAIVVIWFNLWEEGIYFGGVIKSLGATAVILVISKAYTSMGSPSKSSKKE